MTWWYRAIARPALFRFDSEEIHDRTLRGLAHAGRSHFLTDLLAELFGAPALPIDVFGLKFPNPVGLAAGMDKAAAAVPIWEALGFGFCELGGVTWHPQEGNPSPRMFRVPSDRALINRMGFNNPGAEAVAERLSLWRASGRWPAHPVGINLGKSKITPLAEAASDYARSFSVLRQYADFFVVNVSSPNTPGLRQLQDRSALNEILAALMEANAVPRKPILVKVAPDLEFTALDEIIGVAKTRGVAGLVATNTTITRPQINNPNATCIYSESGGLSGEPLRQRSTGIIRHLYAQTNGSLPIVGVGGIFSAEDAWEKIAAGASLVQLYTGLVYEGPAVAKTIVHGLLKKLRDLQLPDLRSAVGLAAKPHWKK